MGWGWGSEAHRPSIRVALPLPGKPLVVCKEGFKPKCDWGERELPKAHTAGDQPGAKGLLLWEGPEAVKI